MHQQIDLMNLWSLIAANGSTGISYPCTIPTSYFMDGLHVFAYVNNINNQCTSTSSASRTSSVFGESEESNTYINTLHELNDLNNDEYGDKNIEEDIHSDSENISIAENTTKEDKEESITDTPTIRNFKRIKRVRYSREEYKCTTCPYTCTTEKAFLKHLHSCNNSNNCSVETQLSCPICGKDYSSEEQILSHMLKHRDGKQFCCDLCKFRTLQMKKLIQHRRMHTGEKPHLCPFCTYRSARRDNLRSHVRRVHKKENLTCDTFTPRSLPLTPATDKSKRCFSP